MFPFLLSLSVVFETELYLERERAVLFFGGLEGENENSGYI